MAKAKPKATILVADGAGGMAKVQDRRFEADWPIAFDVPKDHADSWLKYFYAESGKRGWTCSSIAQSEARENSGSITANVGGGSNIQLALIWERQRGGAMHVRVRPAGLPLTDTQTLLDRVNEQCRAGVTQQVYRRCQLEYEGLPWRGEFWLDSTLRLGPASRQYDSALHGPRVIIVDALAECVSRTDSPHVFDQLLSELSAFLSVVLSKLVRVPEQGRVWTYTNGADDCAVRELGYWERENPTGMPASGISQAILLSKKGSDNDLDEMSLPEDIADLWAVYCALAPELRRQFLQAAAKWQEALSNWERSTLSIALMVVACEALKPAGAEFRRHTIYDVVKALLGKPTADRLREGQLRPQQVRSVHLHRGDFFGSEFVHDAITSSYYDPTFDTARRELGPITQMTIVEWLRRRGVFTMTAAKTRKSVRGSVKEHAMVIVLSAFAIGMILGWLSRTFWLGR